MSMLKQQLLALISCLLCVSNLIGQNPQYAMGENKDSNGLTYRFVSNDPFQTRMYTLGNGLKVYISPEHSDSRVQAMIGIHAGSNLEPEQSTGLAHYLEHMLFKGTDKIGTLSWEKEEPLLNMISELYEQHRFTDDENLKRQIYARIDSLSVVAASYVAPNEFARLASVMGANSVNAATSYDFTFYRKNFPSNELSRWAELESERMSKVVLRLFHTELETVYEEYNRAQDNDSRLIFYAMMEELFPEHPYNRPVLGKPEHLKNPSMVNIYEFFSTYYVPNNMMIILTGDVQAEEAIQVIDKHFGHFQAGALPEVILPEEKPIEKPRTAQVFSDGEERVILAYRFNGKSSQDYKYAVLIDGLLSNSGKTGLFDKNLNQAPTIHSASSNLLFMKDYGIHYLNGVPRPGQSLEEVHAHMRAQLEKLKQGEFEPWMLEALVNNMKMSFSNELDNNMSRANAILFSEMYGQPYQQYVSFLSDLEKISMEELVDFVKRHYHDNYVLVFKRKGEKNLRQVEKPSITPLSLNTANESEFFGQFSRRQPEPLQPEFIDYQEIFPVTPVMEGVDFYYLPESNGRFNFRYLIPLGKDHDPLLSFAIRYFRDLGTSQLSPDSLKQILFRYGISFNLTTSGLNTYINMRGLEEHFDKAMALLRHVFDDVQNDPELFREMVEREQTRRRLLKENERSITFHAQQYMQFGEINTFTNNPELEELRMLDPASLLEKVKGLFNYRHVVFYAGSRPKQEIIRLIADTSPASFIEPPVVKQYNYLPLDKPIVYFMDQNMVQAQVNMIIKNDGVYSPELLAFKEMYDNYYGVGMGSIIFQNIRESRGLAYSAGSYYQMDVTIDEDNVFVGYLGTQPDKLTEAIYAFENLMDVPVINAQKFEFARLAAIKAIESERIPRQFWFGRYMGLKNRGITHDVRQTLYKDLQEMTPEKFLDLFSSQVNNSQKQYFIRSKKENIDFDALKQFGVIKEITLEDIFGF